MGIPDSSLVDLIDKFKSWISWRNSDSNSMSISDNNCGMNLSNSCIEHRCGKCVLKETNEAAFDIKTCNLCLELIGPVNRTFRRIYPCEFSRQSPEPPSPSFSGDTSDGLSRISDESFSDNPSPVSVHRLTNRCDEEGEDTSHFFTSSNEYFDDTSDIDSVISVSARHSFYGFTSVGSSPSESPSRKNIITSDTLIGHFVQQQVLEKPAKRTCDPPQPLDFEINGAIWFPPPPQPYDDDVIDKVGSSFFTYDDSDNEVVEDSRAAVQGHFEGIVSELLRGEGLMCNEQNSEDWLCILTRIAWQAANYVKPDTSTGGSMDPCDYVKVKCVASGKPSESKLIKGVVCTKNIKHKRMTSQYKNTRILLLAGSLEYQKSSDHLSSFDRLLQQENDHLKMIVSKIEAHRPNVLLVEKSVSSFAQEQLLAKEISLVLNVKMPLLERISRCTGAMITPSIDHISTARLGQCELFHLEKISENHEVVNQLVNKRTLKTLMYFEGCPRRLGCTVVLRGTCDDELKKVKKVVKYAVFAAYHLSLETSFFADVSKMTSDNSKQEENDDASIAADEINEASELATVEKSDDSDEGSSVNNKSILVSLSSHCTLNGTVCERSRLLRLKFYGPSDKPLGRYLRDDLFDKLYSCRSCKESREAHAIRYTHPQGNLTVKVKRVSSIRLPGEREGKIWMWQRCLKCTHVEGVPPATRRVVMSDSAWGLSFGKFLELCFSDRACGDHVASCGHSLRRNCLRFYGFGNMVAVFQYSPVNILDVCLPPPILEFCCATEHSWIRNEATELLSKSKALYTEISAVLRELSDETELHSHVVELNDTLAKEENYFEDMLQLAELDILEINRLRHTLITCSHIWNRRLYILDSLLKRNFNPVAHEHIDSLIELKDSETYLKDDGPGYPESEEPEIEPGLQESLQKQWDEVRRYVGDSVNSSNSLERLPSPGSILSDQIDSAWSGADLAPVDTLNGDADVSDEARFFKTIQKEKNPAFRRLLLSSPARVHSFDSAQRVQESLRKVLPLRSFHASGDYRYMLRDPVSSMVQRTHSQVSSREAEKLNLTPSAATSPSFISSVSLLPEGARLIAGPQKDITVIVYDNEPTSIISYALSSKDYTDWVDKPSGPARSYRKLTTWQSFGSLDLEYSGSYASEDTSSHLRISFEDESLEGSGRVRFSVTCYFAREFDALRRRCCPDEVDFIRSMSRCRRWTPQGGKSNVYFAKSFDERFIIKQVTKTEFDSFEEFAPEYFKYLTDALSSGSPTSLAKVLGVYQVTVKQPKGGKETRMDLMVMENIFFGKNISRVYDLKGSARARYNPDKTGPNKVLLDMNLLEASCTNPIYLESKAKRRLERAVWNDTSFLAGVDVMDYSLLVGVDEEREEMVIGIIDYMRQYTWDKHLETWVKASGILGGPKNASPTIVSPKQYKKRFRKAMTTYFLTVPNQWSSS
ncbi:hypothetical protein ABFS82_05G040000 [Erythranthe guttata]